MFEDAYAKHKQWLKLSYQAERLEVAVEEAVVWAEQFVRDFAANQKATLPWLRTKP